MSSTLGTSAPVSSDSEGSASPEQTGNIFPVTCLWFFSYFLFLPNTQYATFSLRKDISVCVKCTTIYMFPFTSHPIFSQPWEAGGTGIHIPTSPFPHSHLPTLGEEKTSSRSQRSKWLCWSRNQVFPAPKCFLLLLYTVSCLCRYINFFKLQN